MSKATVECAGCDRKFLSVDTMLNHGRMIHWWNEKAIDAMRKDFNLKNETEVSGQVENKTEENYRNFSKENNTMKQSKIEKEIIWLERKAELVRNEIRSQTVKVEDEMSEIRRVLMAGCLLPTTCTGQFTWSGTELESLVARLLSLESKISLLNHVKEEVSDGI